MARSSSLPNNTFWRIGLVSCSLVYLTKAQEFRQQELLYGKLFNKKVEFIFLPRDTVAVSELNTSLEIGMSSFERYKGFGDKTKSRKSNKKADLYTMDMIPHNTWWATDDPVSKCRILRVGEDGETSEYIADVVGDGNCFDNVRFVRDSTLFETGDPSEDI
ncbi:hypothetical protein FOZ63_003610, partial [Perkinsus olseni]